MTANDNDHAHPAFLARDISTALALLTRLPLPATIFGANRARPSAQAAWAYPLVGVVVGAGAVLAGLAAGGVGLPAPIQALVILLTGVMLTGAMHEDGLADCADGFWGGWTRERRLEIMKDSQIGSYGVIALVLMLGLRWMAITLLIDGGALVPAVLIAAAASRGAMVWMMYALAPARNQGLSHQTGRPGGSALAGAMGLTIVAAFVSGAALAVLLTGVVLTLGLATLARRKIGGQTGDVLGATQQIVEAGILLALLP